MQNYFKHFILTIFIFFIILGLSAQQSNLPVLGLDNNLCNGVYYSYYYSKLVDGNQFLLSSEYTYGTVWKKSGVYDSILLNYDVLNKKLVLRAYTSKGDLKIIALSLFELDSFYFENKLFVIDHKLENGKNIYQKISYNKLEFKLYSSKELILIPTLDQVKHSFSQLKREIYFYDSNVLFKVSTKRQFLKCIDKKNKSKIKKYIRSQTHKYNNMSDIEYFNLLRFINIQKI